MKYNNVIENKLRLLEKKLEEIESWNIDSFEKLKESSLLQNAVERALQVAIEIMIDISERILSLEKVSPRETSADNIKKLKDLGVIEDSERYIDMVRFRNYIVHRYEYIEPEILYNIVSSKLEAFTNFIHEIRSVQKS